MQIRWDRQETTGWLRRRISLLALATLAFLLLSALPAAAQVITYTSVSSQWRDSQPNGGANDPVIDNVSDPIRVSWGTGGGTPSSYTVDIALQADPTLPPAAEFIHNNFSVSPPWLSSVVLDIEVEFDVDFEGTTTSFGPMIFTYTLDHDETPNGGSCPYPTTGPGCSDRVTITQSPTPTTFVVGGKVYTLGMTFLDEFGNPADEFITEEGGVANTTDLDVQFTLVPPEFVVTKSGPSDLAAGQAGVFTIDAQNVGPNDAWQTTITDLLPDGPTGGLCDATPEILSARVFQSNGSSTVAGKDLMVQGVDFTLVHTGAPTCEFDLSVLTANGVVAENERLIITYQTQLDAGTDFGISLTNVAGATEWFDAEAADPTRGTYTETLATGSVGTADYEDAHTLDTEQLDYLFEKTVVDPVSGTPVTTAVAGDTIRYRVRIENRTTTQLVGLGVTDVIDSLNGAPRFVPGSLTLVTSPAGADTSGTLPLGGTGTGVLDVRDISVAPSSSELVEFDLTLTTPIAAGTLVTNQATLLAADAPLTPSDDPNVGGQADPFTPGDENETVVTIITAPSFLTEKTWADLTGDPAVLRPGDTLRYTITVKNVGTADAVDASILDALPANTTYAVGSTTLNGLGVPDGPGSTLPLASGMPIYAPEDPTPGAMRADPGATLTNVATLRFDVVVGLAVADGTIISNQAFASAVGSGIVDQPSDDPVTPLPDDPTLVAVAASPPDPLLKDITQPSAAVGEVFSYRITIPQNPHVYPLYDVRILDDLTTSAADLRFVSVARVSGTTAWTPVNTGTATNLVIEDTSTGIDIPAGDQIELEISVVLEDTGTNTTGLVFANTAGYTHNWTDGDPGTVNAGIDGVSADMTIEAPDLVMQKSGPPGLPGSATAVYTLDVQNVGGATAWNPTLLDQVANPTPGGMCDIPPAAITAQVFEANGTDAAGPVLVESTDFTASFAPDPTCELTLAFTEPSISIAPTQRLIVTYQLQLDADTPNNVDLTNIAGAIEWFTADGSNPVTVGDRRTVTETLSTGTVGTPDHEDAHTLTTILPLVRFEKTVEDAVALAGPISQASPGDRLRYTIEIENVGATALSNFTFRDEADRLNLAQPAFDPNSLAIVSSPGGAAVAIDGTGGTAGTGDIEVTGLDLPNNGDTATIVFEIDLASVLPGGLVVQNQAELAIGGIPFWMSDDPTNGAADPSVVGDEDPTAFTIVSAPSFVIEKTSADITNDPAVLRAGDTLRYMITVKNVGTENVVDALIRDAVPVNTAYVAGSTFLNGSAVADGPSSTLPLAGGMSISAPEDPTPGAMRADASPTADNVATILFDVVVSPTASDGTVVSNQAFVTAVAGGVIDAPSDDPGTTIVDDPTRDVVGDQPLVFASKDAVISTDVDGDGVADPGDTLQYTIQVFNNGVVNATGVTLQDAVPTNSVYRADTLTLNGAGVGQPDLGVSPLIAGIDIGSSDLPAPAPGAGTISPGQSATIVFEVDVVAGPQVVNQAQVTSNEGGVLLTDGDGDPSTGPEPTVVIVGTAQQLAITKQVTVVGGGPALPGSLLDYVVRISNVGTVDATGVVITDDLNLPVAGQLVFEIGSATLQGAAAGVTYDGLGLLTADYGSTFGPLPVGADAVLRFRASLAAGLSLGDLVQNDALVMWGAPAQNETGSVTVTVGGQPGVAALSGTLWHDVDFDNAIDGGEALLAGWLVDLVRNGTPVLTVAADASGVWSMPGVAPNDVSGEPIELRFRAPDAGPGSASLGTPISSFVNGPQQISNVLLTSGSVVAGLDLPITPNGVVYSSLLRIPVGGATVQLLNEGTGSPVAASCFDDPQQQGQLTRADGFYKFDLAFGQASCPSGGDYLIDVAPPATGYVAGASTLIPPTSDATTTAFDTPACGSGPFDSFPVTTPQHCEVQASPFAPATSVPAGSAGTDYHLNLTFDASIGDPSAQIFNNHVALDPDGADILGLSKTTPKLNVTVGELVPYEIVLSNPLSTQLTGIEIVDRFPAGFRYIEGSARLDGAEQEPVRVGRELTWTGITIPARTETTIVLLLAVGAGVTEGEFTNTAQAIDGPSGIAVSPLASATVRVVADPDFDCTDVLGKVFDDRNLDGIQDEGELGLSGVRLVTPRGLQATTDAHGRFHITCAIVPNERRGSNFVLKLDDRSLPAGARLTSPVTQVKRATRGKALRFRFGATIHRVVGLDVADPVFEPGETDVRAHWQPRIDLLLEELRAEPSLLRLTYAAEKEGRDLVEARLRSLEKIIARGWQADGDHRPRIEREIVWTRGEPDSTSGLSALAGRVAAAITDPFTRDDDFEQLDAPSRSEQSLRDDAPLTLWAVDPEAASATGGDTLEVREVLTDAYETKKMRNVVPPIHFDTGRIEVDPSVVDSLRQVLGGMKHLHNVRLHLVGHADNVPLSGALAARYDDNFGLSRERAGEMAEFVKAALGLSPESISYDGLGESEPVASNATEAGRHQNRRVEVEVWYDVPVKKRSFSDVVISDDVARVKVCRTQTLCKMRFQAGHQRRTRIRNVIAPLQLGEQTVSVPDSFVHEVEQALAELQGERNVTIKFIGYSDGAPLSERAERIYGSQLALSKARARRVALAVKDELRLPSDAVASEGRGTTRPVASNATENGRALNRRVEIEIWHDDPLQELSEDPQLCPDDGGRELLTHVYDPEWGWIAPIPIEDGQPVIASDVPTQLARALGEIADRPGARLRFVGYVRNERLDRRTALAYGDDIGLSTARARRTMERVQETLGLDDTQVEFEGRGFLHSNDVVNAGFVKGDASEVRVEVVYDELARADSIDGIDVTPVSHTLAPQHPLSLNLMRITVDGEPLDDPARSSADLQRCTDVALDGTDMRFHFDEGGVTPRLAVASEPMTVAVEGAGHGFGVLDPRRAPPTDAAGAASVRFRSYTNYAHYVERMEVRIFDRADSVRGEPVAVVPVGPDGTATWAPPLEWFASPMREMKFVLRAYDDGDRFDETAAQPLWLVHGHEGATASAGGAPPASPGAGVIAPTAPGGPTVTWPADRGLYAGYGEAWPVLRNIPLGNAGTVRVLGQGIEDDQRVALAGQPVAVDDEGRFIAEQILPTGEHTVEVAVEDEDGSAQLFLRDLELDQSDWFIVGMADVTFGGGRTTSGDASLLEGANTDDDIDSNADGRFAFFLDGTFGDDWRLTASADTREGEITEIFRNFLDTEPDSLFRRIEPEDHYPTFGDDGTVEQLAPTQGRMYARLSKEQSHLLWGNFRADYLDNELAQLQRGLYGGNVRWQSTSTTSYGEKRFAIDGFAADPGTLTTRESMRGTGGSLYYLRRSDLTIGSEYLRIEVRDKVSGLVKSVLELRPGIDYDVDYLQGRVILSEPLQSTVDDDLLVRTGGRSGDEAWLVVQYEYAPGFDEIDGLTAGGQGHFWLGDFMRIGATASHDEGGDDDTNLFGADFTLRATAGSWLKLQYGRSEGRVATSYRSDDGGFGFVESVDPTLVESDANAYRADLAAEFSDVVPRLPGRITAYGQQIDGGYSAPGLSTPTDTIQAGGTFHTQLFDVLALGAKVDWLREDEGLETSTQEVDVTLQLTESWAVQAGVRNDMREDDSAAPVATQEEGRRTDGVLEVEFDSQSTWTANVFGQGTLSSTGNREDNVRYGAGGEILLTDKLSVEGDISHGDGGVGAHIGTNYQMTRDSSMYMTYGLENERSAAGSMRRGDFVSGARSRFSDSTSVFAENRYTHSRFDRGLVRAAGMDMKFFDRWTVAANVEVGTLEERRTAAETERYAAGGNVGYDFGSVDVSAGVEFRHDDIEQSDGTRSDRTTWLFKAATQTRVNPDWRLLANFAHSFSDSSEGTYFDGGFTEAVGGFAYRPVGHDRLDVLAKYTYFFNRPTTDQVTGTGAATEYLQRSHIGAFDLTYDITDSISLGGKYAYRRGEISLDRVTESWFSNDAHLGIVRADYRFLSKWEALGEGRILYLPGLDERKSGALIGLFRYLGKNFKAGVGYNFTDFSEDLTDLGYDHHGVFINLIGTL